MIKIREIIGLIPTIIFSLSSFYFFILLITVDGNKTVVIPLQFLYALLQLAFLAWAKVSYNQDGKINDQ